MGRVVPLNVDRREIIVDRTFLNLVRSNRLTAHMGLKLDNGVPPKYGRDYVYIEVPLRQVLNADGEVINKVLRNQHVKLVPACAVDVRGHYTVLVKTNPLLQAISNCPTTFLLDVGEGEQPSFYASFRKDYTPAEELTWVVRLYLLS